MMDEEVDLQLNASEMEIVMFREKLLNELRKHPLIQEIELRRLDNEGKEVRTILLQEGN